MSFKIFFTLPNKQTEIRRISSSTSVSWQQFQGILKQICPLHYSPSSIVQYEDDEKELIRITSEVEWQEALSILKPQTIKKIYVSEIATIPLNLSGQIEQIESVPSEPQLKVEPSEIPTSSSISEESALKRESFVSFAESIPKLLENLFNGRGIAFELPDWLREALLRAKKEGQQIDLTKIYNDFVEKGVHFLNDEIYENGKKAFESLLVLKERHPEILQSLTLQAEAALEQIQNLNFFPPLSSPLSQPVPPRPVQIQPVKIQPVQPQTVVQPSPVQSQPQPQPQPVEAQYQKYADQLQVLCDMGFRNIESNNLLLHQANGDLEAVIGILLEGSP